MSFLMAGSSWLCQRSRHCLPVRPGSEAAMTDQRFVPCSSTSERTVASSSAVHGRERGAFLPSASQSSSSAPPSPSAPRPSAEGASCMGSDVSHGSSAPSPASASAAPVSPPTATGTSGPRPLNSSSSRSMGAGREEGLRTARVQARRLHPLSSRPPSSERGAREAGGPGGQRTAPFTARGCRCRFFLSAHERASKPEPVCTLPFHKLNRSARASSPLAVR